MSNCLLQRRQLLQTGAASVLGAVVLGDRARGDRGGGEQLWDFETGDSLHSSPTVVGGTVFIGSQDRDVYALDVDDGSERWRFNTSGSVFSSPTVVDGTVFVGSNDAHVYALNAADGTEQWSFDTGNDVQSSPTVADETVFVGSHDNHVYALDTADGTERWRFETGSRVQSSPTVVDGTIVVGSGGWEGDGHVHALNAATGVEEWVFEPDDSVRSSPTVADRTVVVGSDDNHVYALDAENGGEQWRFETGGWVRASPTVADSTVVVGSGDRHVYALDVSDGSEQWAFETGGRIRSSPTVAEGTVFVASRDNHVYALDAAKGTEQWRFETGDRVRWSSPTVADGIVVIGSYDNRVYALDAGVEGSSEGSRVRLGTLGHHTQFTGDMPTTEVAVERIGTNAPIEAGTDLEIDLEVTNYGVTRAQRTVEIEVKHLAADPVAVEMDVDSDDTATATITLPTTADEGGEYHLEVSIEDDTVAKSIRILRPAAFRVDIVDTNAPIAPGMDLEATLEVTNTGDIEATQVIEVGVDDPDVDPVSIEVPLEGGESTTEVVALEWSSDDPGNYTVSATVDNRTEEHSITITDPSPPDSGSDDSSATDHSSDDASPTDPSRTESPTITTVRIPTERVTWPVTALGITTLAAAGYLWLRQSRSAGDDDAVIQNTRSIEAVRSGADDHHDAARRAREDFALEDALDHYEDALEMYEHATEQLRITDADVDDLSVSTEELKDTIHTVRTEMVTVQALVSDRTELAEVLSAAEAQLREAVAAHVRGHGTVARTRYRQARQNYQKALELLDHAEQDILAKPVATDVEMDGEPPAGDLDTFPGIDTETLEVLAEADIETVADLRTVLSAGDEDAAAADSTGPQQVVDRIGVPASVESSVLSLIQLLPVICGPREDRITITTREEIVRKRDQATRGFEMIG